MQLKCVRAVLQDRAELYKFIELIRAERVTSYLEIGSKHGGTLWHIGTALPAGSRIVSVDLPHGDESFKESQPHLEACVAELVRRGYDARLILGDSTAPEIVAQAAALGPFDLLFIDANHTEPYIRADWKNYGPLARLVAFHDIADDLQRPPHKMPIQVMKVWRELKTEYRHREISNTPHHNGIGILWRTMGLRS